MTRSTAGQPPRRTRGFSLLEMGIAIGCVAILLLIVFQAKGFVDSSRLHSTVQSVKTIQKAAILWSERNAFGRNYNGITGLPANDARGNLCGFPTFTMPLMEVREAAVDCGYRTGWDMPLVVLNPSPRVLDVRFCLPTPSLATDARNLLTSSCAATFVVGVCPGCAANCLVSCSVF